MIKEPIKSIFEGLILVAAIGSIWMFLFIIEAVVS